ncbi:Peptide hydrolase [Fusarium falciforme]|uniref:Peptide hydrolase n=1 Tax=Fusarium falciforme TaxID=195108 RepID=UPI0022FFD1E5|nr:Peptide hydrolase [Fusarium falciforme]WAO96351.1 Peptide hydrolase [Fusarium falciforme]
MRYTVPLVVALAASVSAAVPRAPLGERADKLFTLEIAPGETVEVTEDEKFQMIDDHIHFFDITEWKDHQPASAARLLATTASYPSKVQHKSNVEKIIKNVDLKKIEKQLKKFSSFHNRYFNSKYGVEAAEWLHKEVKKVIKKHPLATVRLIQHQAWSQPSIVVSIPGKVRLKTIITGSHLDSVISNDRGAGRAPGADDNGSASIMLLNVLDAFLKDPRIAKGDHDNTVEFHWYSAKETGLLGSQDIFNTYSRLGIQVEAMLNQDMVGYKGRDGVERFGLITDNTDPGQNDFLKVLIEEYADIPYEESQCGYACSDHASANRNGFPSSFLFETPFGNHNPHIHTPNDTIAYVDFDHIAQHVKVTTGFVYELAHHDFINA